MPSTNLPTVDLAGYLDTNSTRVTLGTNLFYGLVRESDNDFPGECVFVMNVGGRTPDRTFSTTIEIRYSDVQIRVRSTSVANGESLVDHIYRVLQSASPTNYLDVRSFGNPVFLEEDEKMNYHWALNFTLMYNST